MIILANKLDLSGENFQLLSKSFQGAQSDWLFCVIGILADWKHTLYFTDIFLTVWQHFSSVWH